MFLTLKLVVSPKEISRRIVACINTVKSVIKENQMILRLSNERS